MPDVPPFVNLVRVPHSKTRTHTRRQVRAVHEALRLERKAEALLLRGLSRGGGRDARSVEDMTRGCQGW